MTAEQPPEAPLPASAEPQPAPPAPAPPAPAAPPAGPPPIRASDAERDEVIQRLSVAVSEGRLTLEEHITRVDQALAAGTRSELEPIVADLPATFGSVAPVPPQPPPLPAARQKGHWIVSIMGEHHRRGRWRMTGHTRVLTVMGETDLDLRGALIEEPEVYISAWLLMGEQKILVPKGIDVEVTGFLFMGSRKVRTEDTLPRPGAPKVHIHSIGMMGELKIEAV